MQSVILFDGVCNFCIVIVKTIIKHDHERRFHFASIQTKQGRAILREHNEFFANLKTIYLVDNGKVYKRSAAIFKIFQKLPAPLKFFSIFRVFPVFFTDLVYKIIAKYRYLIFGKKDEIIVPDASIKDRFI